MDAVLNSENNTVDEASWIFVEWVVVGPTTNDVAASMAPKRNRQDISFIFASIQKEGC